MFQVLLLPKNLIWNFLNFFMTKYRYFPSLCFTSCNWWVQINFFILLRFVQTLRNTSWSLSGYKILRLKGQIAMHGKKMFRQQFLSFFQLIVLCCFWNSIRQNFCKWGYEAFCKLWTNINIFTFSFISLSRLAQIFRVAEEG